MKQLFAIVLIYALINAPLFADTSKVAKVMVLRGNVKANNPNNGEVRDLKKDDWVAEKAIVQTADQSFVKLIFSDNSQISLGPKSQMVISQFSKDEAGVVNLVKGQIRSQVQKDPLKPGETPENKLFIKTKTAAMGVRGTEFKVVYNAENEVTSLVTFSGEVAMAQVSDSNVNNVSELNSAVNGPTAVSVKEGQYSGANPANDRASVPVKISPAQLESLKGNEDYKQSTASSTTSQKKYISPIPPGVSSKTFVNDNKVIETQIAQAAPESTNSNTESSADTSASPPPEGFYDASTGAFAPAAGGFVDISTGLYVAPPPGSTFDPNTGVYIPPANIGNFDAATGEYVAPAGFTLKADGSFETSSANASENTSTQPPPPKISFKASDMSASNFEVVRTFDKAAGPGQFSNQFQPPVKDLLDSPDNAFYSSDTLTKTAETEAAKTVETTATQTQTTLNVTVQIQ